jgi:hypothetical protein
MGAGREELHAKTIGQHAALRSRETRTCPAFEVNVSLHSVTFLKTSIAINYRHLGF